LDSHEKSVADSAANLTASMRTSSEAPFFTPASETFVAGPASGSFIPAVAVRSGIAAATEAAATNFMNSRRSRRMHRLFKWATIFRTSIFWLCSTYIFIEIRNNSNIFLLPAQF
jgi:hypothetical protein